jgi:hypothetical protein
VARLQVAVGRRPPDMERNCGYLNKQSWTADERGSPAWISGDGQNTAHRKNLRSYKMC